MFDFGTDDVGKPLGIDIKEKKVTLPLIYALNNSNTADKKRMINLVKNHNDDPEKIAQIINFVKETGGLQYAETPNEKIPGRSFCDTEYLPRRRLAHAGWNNWYALPPNAINNAERAAIYCRLYSFHFYNAGYRPGLVRQIRQAGKPKTGRHHERCLDSAGTGVLRCYY